MTASVRPLPPFLPPRPPRLTLHVGGRRSAEPELRQLLAELLADPQPRPGLPPTPALPAYPVASANGTGARPAEQQHQMDEIAGSLEDVARLLRGRGFSALSRNEPDPLNRRLLRVIADHLATRG